jgi:hypothetical protein
MLRLKYTGAFRDLPPLGYQFQKMYARNYRCYHSYEIGNGRMSFWIWQKNRDICIEDWYDLTVPVMNYVLTHPVKTRVLTLGNGQKLTCTHHTLICNRTTNKVEKKTPANDHFYKFVAMEHGEITKKEYDDYMKYYKENLREIIVESAELKAELERLKGKYEIVNEP